MLLRSCFLIVAFSAVLMAADTKQIHQTRPLDADGRVVVDTYKGSINVSTWDRPEVDISATLEEDGGMFAQSVRFSDVRVTASQHEVTIKSVDDGFLMGSAPLFKYTIRMPRTARLAIHDYKSDTVIDNLAADFDMNTYKGNVQVHNFNGSLTLETYKGDVKIDAPSLHSPSRINTYKGDIEIRLPRDARFSVRADLSRNAHLSSEFGIASNTSTRNRRDSQNVQGPVNGGGPELNLSSYKGNFRLLAR